ncbi:alpha/beta fold hydrolase [Azonexus sp. IMCC34839]|uniref:alpha/beta fold hydrolase n=1 Tax=Azonexus sp. IMCC34839 TaxID=3133695 RepID=UPI00399A1187
MNILQTIVLGCALTIHANPANAYASAETTHYVERNPGRIAYDDSGGNGPVVIAIPGMGDLRGQYRFLRPRLIHAGYRVITMDIRGHGDSSVQWSDYSAKATAEDALAVMDQLGTDTAFIVGNSFAAGAGLWAARQRPEAILGVAMIGPILRDIPSSPLIKGIVYLGLAGPWRVGFWTTYWDSLFTLNKPSDHAAYRERLVANLREEGRMNALRQMVALSKADTESIVGKIPVPVLVIMGSRDPDFRDPMGEAAWLSGKTKGQVAIVQGAGHYPHVELPDLVAGELATFLDRLKGQR